jgi:hypothetical protein
MTLNPHTLDPSIPPTLEDDGYEEIAPPDPEHISVHAVLEPDNKQTDGPWFAECEPNITHGDSADVFYIARLLQIVATQVAWLNSGADRGNVEKWGFESVATAKSQYEADNTLERIGKQIEASLTPVK